MIMPISHPQPWPHSLWPQPLLITQFAQHTKQQAIKTKLLETYNTPQHEDRRYIHPRLFIPHLTLPIQECIPDNDIIAHKPTIQIHPPLAQIHGHKGDHETTITLKRHQWLKEQYSTYTTANNLSHSTLDLENGILTPNSPLRQTITPLLILDNLISTFQPTHSYFSDPLTCSINFTQYRSPHARDKFFGSLGPPYSHEYIIDIRTTPKPLNGPWHLKS